MQPSKFVVKCGRFAVLVDPHILPQGGQNSSNWFSQEHKEEVSALIKDAIEQRVRQFLEGKQGQSKQRKELSPGNPLFIKGQTLRLAVYFMKRHVNLRCIIRQHYREMRVFPERLVVCLSLSENDVTSNGNLNPDIMEPSEQSRSRYFSGPGETLDPLNSSTITKRTALQKITRQTSEHPPLEPANEIRNQNQGVTLTRSSTDEAEAVLGHELSTQWDIRDASMLAVSEGDKGNANQTAKVKPDDQAEDCPEKHDGHQASETISQDDKTTGRRRRRRIPSSPRDATDHQEAKRVCLGEPLIGSETSCGSTMGHSPSSPGAAVQAPPECMLEEELLTHGKQPPRLPLSNSTAKHTNQSRLATSLRGLSVKAVSSGSSISSRSAAKEEEKQSVPRISRLRRLKKS